MNISDIKILYRDRIDANMHRFIGQKVTEELRGEAKRAIQDALVEAWRMIPLAVKEELELRYPFIDVEISGSEIHVTWTQGRP